MTTASRKNLTILSPLRNVFQVKIWFQNRRSKCKKMLKASANNPQAAAAALGLSQPVTPNGGPTTPGTPTSGMPPSGTPPSDASPSPHTPPTPFHPGGSLGGSLGSALGGLANHHGLGAGGGHTPAHSLTPPPNSWDMPNPMANKAPAMMPGYMSQYTGWYHGHPTGDPNQQVLT